MKVLLIGFYNPKALGLRYLEQALLSGGHEVRVVFFKSFNSIHPKPATETELALLRSLTEEYKPGFIGLSVMASLYRDTVDTVNAMLREHFDVPLVWGGTIATMFPEETLKQCDYAIRGEGEDAIIELADALEKGSSPDGILNLAYMKEGRPVVNGLRPLLTELDRYGLPDIGGDNKYFIDNNTLSRTDPQLSAYSYETGASRGCPFACSYCCSINLNRLSAHKGAYVRFRDPDTVIEELLIAKKKMKKLVVIHFWDEIFSDDKAWIDRFVKRYSEEIHLPFEIWGHPLKTDRETINKLREAGLYKVVMGIQSGSPYIRKEVFHRPETQEAILKAARVLKSCGVPHIIYDFMLRHPFETHETIRETFALCLALPKGFSLQMHGLNFLPGTDIVDMAINQGLVSPEEMADMLSADMQKQYEAHWKRDNNDPVINFWYHLTYLTQFRSTREKAVKLSKLGPSHEKVRKKAAAAFEKAQKLEKIRTYRHKATIVWKGIRGRF